MKPDSPAHFPSDADKMLTFNPQHVEINGMDVKSAIERLNALVDTQGCPLSYLRYPNIAQFESLFLLPQALHCTDIVAHDAIIPAKHPFMQHRL